MMRVSVKKLLYIVSLIALILSIAIPVSATSWDPAPNPPLDLACSLNVIFVLDESGSIVGSGTHTNILTEVRDAANGFLNALADTGSDIAIIEFNTTARLAVDYMPLSSANVANVLTPYVNGTGPTPGTRYNPYEYSSSSTPSYYTNWEAALNMVASVNANPANEVADLIVFFTDGDPTAHYDSYGNVVIDSSNNDSHVPAAREAANTVKGQGSHIFVVGVPNPEASAARISQISGPDEYGVDTSDFSVADYTLTTSSALYDSLRDIAFALCEGSVSLTKTIWDGHEYVDIAGWEFSGTVRVTSGGAEDAYSWLLPVAGAASDVGMTQIGVTDENGSFTWQWKPDADYPTEMVLDEAEEGVIFEEAICTRVIPGQDDEQFTLYELPLTITFGLQEFVTCEFRNIAEGLDWADAADTYGTLAAALGPRHIIVPGATILGSVIDAESDGKPTAAVNGDDLDQSDDEDGFEMPVNEIWNDGDGEINVTASGAGCLNVWVDFNNLANEYQSNGVFNNQEEHVISNTVVMTGTTMHEFPLPLGQIHDESLVLRLRITPLVDGQCNDNLYRLGNPSPYFLALGGEVEDHIVTLGPTAITLLSVSTESEVSRLPFLGIAILLAVTMLVVVYYQRRREA